MRCPDCQFDNPESMKFCGQCGADGDLKKAKDQLDSLPANT